jgi:hypothetical protein
MIQGHGELFLSDCGRQLKATPIPSASRTGTLSLLG